MGKESGGLGDDLIIACTFLECDFKADFPSGMSSHMVKHGVKHGVRERRRLVSKNCAGRAAPIPVRIFPV
jgi:hypothetical protein